MAIGHRVGGRGGGGGGRVSEDFSGVTIECTYSLHPNPLPPPPPPLLLYALLLTTTYPPYVPTENHVIFPKSSGPPFPPQGGK